MSRYYAIDIPALGTSSGSVTCDCPSLAGRYIVEYTGIEANIIIGGAGTFCTWRLSDWTIPCEGVLSGVTHYYNRLAMQFNSTQLNVTLGKHLFRASPAFDADARGLEWFATPGAGNNCTTTVWTVAYAGTGFGFPCLNNSTPTYDIVVTPIPPP